MPRKHEMDPEKPKLYENGDANQRVSMAAEKRTQSKKLYWVSENLFPPTVPGHAD